MSHKTYHKPVLQTARARFFGGGRRSAGKHTQGGLRRLRLVLLILVVAPLVAAPGTAQAPLLAGVALLAAVALLGGVLLRSLDRVLPGRGGRLVSTALRSALAYSLKLIALVALTLGAVVLAGLVTSPRQAAAAPLLAQRMPRPIPGLDDVRQIDTVAMAHFAVKNDGTVWAWGKGQYGALGTGDLVDRTYPTPVCASGSGTTCVPLTGVISIAVGRASQPAYRHHVLALKDDGTVWAWGPGDYGRLGIGTVPANHLQLNPAQVVGLSGVTAIDVGYLNSYAVTSDGALWSWGPAGDGALGDGIDCGGRVQSVPQRVSSLPPITAVSAYMTYAFALDGTGIVWSWGRNHSGVLGRPLSTGLPYNCASQIPSADPTPKAITGVSGVASIAAGVSHALALTTSGQLWGWGTNQQGYLGNIPLTSYPAPTQLTPVTNAARVISGEFSTSILTTTGDVIWLYVPQSQPVTTGQFAQPGIERVIQYASGELTHLAVKAPGQVWVWGSASPALGLDDPYSILHNTPPSVPWTGFAGQGVNVTSGTFHHQQVDLTAAGRGASLALVRTYNSGDLSDIGFGPGWSFNYYMQAIEQADKSVLVRMEDGRQDRYTYTTQQGYTSPPGVYNRLTRAADKTFILTTPDQFVHRFDARGRLVSIADRNNNITALTWTAIGVTVADVTGRQFVLTYGTGTDFGHFVELKEVGILNRSVEYRYDPATGDLHEVEDVRNGVTTLTYEQHRLATLVDQVGNTVVSNHWDAATGRVVGQDDANTVAGEDVVDGQQPFTINYNTPGETKVTNRRGYVTTFTYDSAYRLTAVKDAKHPNPLQLTWDSRNDLRCVTDRKGNRTGYRYDSRGNVDRIVPPEVADAACEPTVASKVYTFTYTTRNDLQTAAYPAVPLPLPGNPNNEYRRTYTYGYTNNGNLQSIDMPPPFGRRLTYGVDPANGDVRSATDENGFMVEYGYDDHGMLEWFTDPSIPVEVRSDYRTWFVNDAAGRVKRRTGPLGAQVAYEYTDADELRETTVTIEPGIRYGVTTTEYDLAGRATDLYDAENHRTHIVYDPNGNRKQVYAAYTTPDVALTAYRYDANGNLRVLSLTDGIGASNLLETTYFYGDC